MTFQNEKREREKKNNKIEQTIQELWITTKDKTYIHGNTRKIEKGTEQCREQ